MNNEEKKNTTLSEYFRSSPLGITPIEGLEAIESFLHLVGNHNDSVVFVETYKKEAQELGFSFYQGHLDFEGEETLPKIFRFNKIDPNSSDNKDRQTVGEPINLKQFIDKVKKNRWGKGVLFFPQRMRGGCAKEHFEPSTVLRYEFDPQGIKDEKDLVKSLTEQVKKIRFLISCGICVTAVVYSGGKSLHVYIRLEDPVNDKEYRYLNICIASLLKGDLKVASNIVNQTRPPGFSRNDKGREQTLLYRHSIPNNNEDFYCYLHDAFGKIGLEMPKREDTSATQGKSDSLKMTPTYFIHKYGLENIEWLIKKVLALIPPRTPKEGSYLYFQPLAGAFKNMVGEQMAVALLQEHSPNEKNWSSIVKTTQANWGLPALSRAVRALSEHKDWELPAPFNQKINQRLENQKLEGVNQWTCLDSHFNELGYWSKKEEKLIDKNGQPVLDEDGKPEIVEKFIFNPLADFDIDIIRAVKSSDGGGYLLRVTQSVSNISQSVFISGEHLHTVKKFQEALSKGFGCPLVINFSDKTLRNLFRVKRAEYKASGGKIYQLATRHGQQEDGTWVFPNIQFTQSGEMTSPDESGWLFNDDLGVADGDTPPIPDVDPEQDPMALKALFDALTQFYGESERGTVAFQLAYAIAHVHIQEIMDKEKSFPVKNSYGDPGTGKSIIDDAILSIFGLNPDEASLSSVTESALYETLKMLGSVPIVLDDPKRDNATDELVKRLYNLKPRKVRNNLQTPNATAIVNSNHAIGDEQPATLTRLFKICPRVAEDAEKSSNVWMPLRKAMENASQCFQSLIKVGYPRKEIRQMEQHFMVRLPRCHNRAHRTLALLTVYCQKLLILCGYSPNLALDYAEKNLVPQYAATMANVSSLTLFLEYMQALKQQSILGEWNYSKVERDGKRYLAVHFPSVWREVDNAFNPTFSRSVVEQQIVAKGGMLNQVAKIYQSKDEVQTYQRLLIAENEPKPPKKKSAKCHFISFEEIRLSINTEFLGTEKDELPQLPSVTFEGNCYNPYDSVVSDIQLPKLPNLKIEKEEEEKKFLDSTNGQKGSEKIIDYLDPSKKVTQVTQIEETQLEQGLQQLPSEVTEGNGENLKIAQTSQDKGYSSYPQKVTGLEKPQKFEMGQGVMLLDDFEQYELTKYDRLAFVRNGDHHSETGEAMATVNHRGQEYQVLMKHLKRAT